MPNRRRKLKLEKTYWLWTFQSVSAVKELQSKGILQANWDSYSPTGYFTKSYQWMVKQMAERHIRCDNHAPIWAWHSCEKYGKAPRLVDARCLLSDRDIEAGVQTIEFECPVELVLLSNYGIWNNILDTFCSDKDQAVIDQETVHTLFETGRKKFRKYDSIQATLPYLKLDWVKEIRDLNLKPNDFSYSIEEEV